MNIIKLRGFSFVEIIIGLLLIIYPAAMFAIKGGMNASFMLLLLMSIAVLIFRSHESPAAKWGWDMHLYLASMAALPIAIFLSQSYHHYYSGHPYDAASRFLLAVPVFMFLRRVRFNVLAMVQYGFPLAVIVGCLMLKPIDDGRFGIATLDLIHFGNFELMLGMMSLLSLDWTKHDALWLRIFKVIGFFAGIYASIMSGSRGGWIALPLFLLIYLYFRFGKISPKMLMMSTMMLFIASVIVFTFSHEIHHRKSHK